MANTAYCGVPGSGKTYEVVTEVILPALRSGRRVVSNIAGLHYDEMRAFLLESGTAEGDIGTFEAVTKEQIGGPLFWAQDGRETTVKPGDLVILDECWRWMSAGAQIPPSMFAFLREHRHFVDAKGVSCDIVLITQSIGDLDRKVRVVIEKHFVMEKLKRLGLTKQYTVDVYNKWSSTKANFLRRIVRKYNKEFFPFYSSYDGKGGDEREVDKRINVLRRPMVLVVLIAAPLLLVGGMYGTWRIWDKYVHPKKVEPVAAAGPVAEGGAAKPGGPVAPVVQADKAALASASAWRVVGRYAGGGREIFMVQSGERMRYINAPQGYRLSGLNVELFIDGEFVSSYGGGPARGVGGVVLGTK